MPSGGVNVKSASETSAGQIPVGEISPELRLPRFIFVGDHNASGQRLATLGNPHLKVYTCRSSHGDMIAGYICNRRCFHVVR